ncbi:DUF2314 domain-containing protein [Aliikangiella marina]|uniref:DUF2314 domain-containing protein n=1 Tax=Aliikangiella marina TaxID=1712262 RepID=A0A545TJ04_9GAMM|nr:DUF2314 domain-containing protein [Aliikangiella marina]TQV77212.1 DUF2314 domain-containing protein [Aliikangiella marina]
MNFERLLKTSLLLHVLILVLSYSTHLLASDQQHPGIFLRHIVYFQDVNVAQKAFKDALKGSTFKKVEEFPKTAELPIYNHYLVEDVSQDFPMPNPRYLSYFGRGMTDEEREKVQGFQSAVLYDFMFPLSARESSLYELSQAALAIAEKHGGYIWDSETRELFNIAEWRRYRIDSWRNKIPNVKLNTVIHAYQEGESYRAITLGMAKFGFPDLVINGFDWNDSRSISSLINLTAQQVVEQGLNSFQFELDVNSLKESSYKLSLLDSLYENASKSAPVNLVESKPHQGDPDNFLLEFEFNQYEGKNRYQKQSSLLNRLFGWKDEVTYVKHNAMIEAASQAAREKLPGLQKRFNAGLEVGEGLSLKAPFKTTSGGNEWMWVQVVAWKGNEIKGILRNIPRQVPELKEGDSVIILQQDVFDYIFYHKDGSSEGNKTGELIEKFQQR